MPLTCLLECFMMMSMYIKQSEAWEACVEKRIDLASNGVRYCVFSA
jgi:hypothetical protein